MHKTKISNIIKTFIIWTSAFFFVGYLAILLAFPKNFNITHFKTQFEEQIYKQSGLKINVEKVYVEPSLSSINLEAQHIIVLYPNKKELLKVKDLELKIKVLPLLQKKIEFDKITATRPILSIDIDKDGNCSLDKYLKLNLLPQEDINGFKISETIQNIELKNYRIKFHDSLYHSPFIAEGKKISLSKSFNQNFKLSTEGALSNLKKEYIFYNANCETSLTTLPEKLFNTNPFRYIKQYDITAKIITDLKISIENKNIVPKGTTTIENLKINLDGRTLSDNYIKLELLNKQIKINSDLKTSPTDKIKVAGTIWKNNDFDLICKANNINLFYLKKTVETLLNTINIPNELNKYSVNGIANIDFKIKSNMKSITSSGIAEILNASIKSNNMPYEITGINSKINFANNKIQINSSKMYVNKTPIFVEGNVDSATNLDIKVKSNNLSIESLSKIFVPKDLPTIKGILDITANITGNLKTPKPVVLAELKNFSAIQNNKTLIIFGKGKINLSGTIQNPKGQIEISQANILPTDLLNLIKANKLNISFNEKEIKFKNDNTDKILFEGTITNYANEKREGSIKYSGKIDSPKAYALIRKQNPELLASTKGEIGINGTANLKNNNINIKSEIFANETNYISCLVIKELLNKPSVTTLDINTDGKFLNINNITVAQNNQTKDKIITVLGKIKDINNIELNKFRIIIPKAMTFAVSNLPKSEITINSDLTLDGKIKKPSIKGTLNIENINIPEYKISSKTNHLTFEQNNIKVIMNNLNIGKSNFDISADITPELNKIINIKNIDLKSNYLDLDEISENFEANSTTTVYPGIELPIKANKGTAEIKTFKIGGIQGDNITGDISINNNILKINNIKGAAYGGSLFGKAEYNFLKTSSLTEISGKQAQLSPLFYALTGQIDGTTGIIDYKLKLSATGTKKIQQIRTGKGYLEYTATRGIMGPLGQFEHFLYAQNLISDSIFKTSIYKISKAVKPQHTGVYTISKGNMEINKGMAYLKPLTVEGPNMSLYITGKINLLNENADIKIYGRISQEIEDILGILSRESSQTILTNSSQTSIGNLFYNEYNTQLPKSITDAIPPLNPNTGINSRPFEVIIQGSQTNIKAVKSFKWIVNTTKAPSPNTRRIESNTQPKTEQTIQKQTTTNTIQQQTKNPEYVQTEKPKYVNPNQLKKPSFMDSLPDNIN